MLIRRTILLILSAAFYLWSSLASAQTTTPNPCDPAQQDIILQYVSDQVSILQNSGVTPIRGLSSDDNKTFLKLWAKSYLTGLCQTPAGSTNANNDQTIANIVNRLTTVENILKTPATAVVDWGPVNLRLSGLEASVNQLSGLGNQLTGLAAGVTAANNQIAFLGTAVSSDQATLRSLQSSLDSLNSRISRLTTGPATISNVTITRDTASANTYKLSWQSDVPSSAFVYWGYSHGYYPYMGGLVPSGLNSYLVSAARGTKLYLKIVCTQSFSGVKSESEEFAVTAP